MAPQCVAPESRELWGRGPPLLRWAAMANGARTTWSTAAAALVRALPGLAPAVLIIALLACVLVPLPTPLVDLLLSMSLAAAVLLLVAALLVRRTTDFLSFPTLLLLVTLYRLALNVSTTRLILSQADAGRVIDAFAGVVVRDDLLVGGVMFAIITIVQYVVIARGAERVAEVGARFALDGLPGHQAAIDADLRAKVISPREAAMRRARLGERSNFYGAMDGAMRFVKGDAVVGLAITAVNLVGGLAIGSFRHGLDVGASLDTYGRLTIGDGLLAQLPALLTSLAAGVLVSRVDREGDARASLAGWLDPAMLLVPAVFLVVMALVPGMPALAFVTTAVALLTLALLLSAREDARRPVRPLDDVPRIEARLGAKDDDGERSLERALAEVRIRCSEALRMPIPEIDLVLEPTTPEGRIEVVLDDRRLVRSTVPTGSGRDDAVVLVVFRAVMDHAGTLVDLEDIDRAIDETRANHPAVVERALERVSVVDLLGIVRGLLRERIPMPPMRTLLSAIVDAPKTEAELLEWTRQRLAPLWLQDVIDALERLGPPQWLRPDPDLEDELLDRDIVGVHGRRTQLAAEERARWVARLTSRPPAEQGTTRPLVVLTSPRARPVVADMLAGVTPHVPVLSTAELDAAGIAVATAVHWLAPA
jgi:type III secretion protein V